MAEVLSMALFEHKGRVLVVRKKEDAASFAARWLLPTAQVSDQDSAEEALSNHAYRDLNVQIGNVEFADTLSILDETDGRRHVANVFRVVGYE